MSSSSTIVCDDALKSPFTTTSDVLRQLNAALDGLGNDSCVGEGNDAARRSEVDDGQELDVGQGDNSDSDSNSNSNRSATNDEAIALRRKTPISPGSRNKKTPGFELQRKFEALQREMA